MSIHLTCVDKIWLYLVFHRFYRGFMELLLIAGSLFIGWFIWGRKPISPQRKYPNHSRPLTPNLEGHLSLVTRCNYEAQRVMNKSEFKVFRLLKKKLGSQYYIFPQVALGEVLRSDEGHRAINAKRVDLLVVDFQGFPVAAVEYNGTGHYQGNSAERDAVKYTALTKAKVKYIAIESADEKTIDHALQLAGLLPESTTIC